MTKKTQKPTGKVPLSWMKKLSPDDPIYKAGFVIGQRQYRGPFPLASKEVIERVQKHSQNAVQVHIRPRRKKEPK